METSAPRFVTIRLGKDSISEIQAIDQSEHQGLLKDPLEISVRCTQVSDDVTKGSFAFVWLGSDNRKGQGTQWHQGFKAFGLISELDLKGWTVASRLTISIHYIFPNAIDRKDFLWNAADDYKHCCSCPIVGLDDRANQTVRLLREENETSQISAFLHCICGCDAAFKDSVTEKFPVLAPCFQRHYRVNGGNPPSIDSTPDDALNLIVCGAPGTGKSSWVQQTYEKDSYNWKRITFHPEYSYFDFIGSYKPVPVYEKKCDKSALFEANGLKSCKHGVPHINYRFVPGPFINLFVEAVLHPEREHVLIIEEINRADAASVFGEMLQVLDRAENGESRYAVDISPELQDFFMQVPTEETPEAIRAKLQNIGQTGLKIPKNMRLIATMNGSDQGVQPLDAAFKRRWDFRYMPLVPTKAVNSHEVLCYSGAKYFWCDFVIALNSRLALEFDVPEDRLIGPYFIKPGLLSHSGSVQKLLLYLRDDIARHTPHFFNSEKRDLASLIQDFPTVGTDILGIRDKLATAPTIAPELESDSGQDFANSGMIFCNM